ncbi:CaiB/BaiF CoA transferase family protein [Amycolatopsis jiangsuensis]|uniref:Crotonobetainyl-CoA:carnitine CoA-transferase CaiB-like acyl-CoA transferase n=1 Tax=Amycolatopsis jiangsuensis TaxID=1181879 RepID=A0A840J2N4_9PSEU|nr:CoA transferase [Amycolatopsis jiangsuensis]MBB4688133.1 crotonobetainyl-CoA:carnitine CoA-transferase CaiB-like acyl-CoA transferase [Amycolatopsis jiangsuensis]
MTSSDGSAGPLAGVRVVDLSSAVMGPYATQILGDFGAEVIRVEPLRDVARVSPAGVGRSAGMAPLYLQVNRNKRSVSLDLKDEAGRDDLLALLEDADVFVTNMRAAALDRLGLGYDDLRERFPRLVYAHAQGFAVGSSRAGRPAYDEVIQAASGLVSLQDRAGGTLQFVPTYIADKTAALYLLNGVLAALFDQQRTGSGQRVELAMADAMIAVNLVEHLAGDVFVPAAGDVGNPLSLSATHAAMRTADGGAISAVPYTNAAVRTLLTGAGLTDDAADPAWDSPVIDREIFTAGVEKVLANSENRTTAEWEDFLTQHDVPYAVVVDIADLPADPYVREVGLITEREHPTEGTIRVVENPLHFSRTPAGFRGHAERAGASTAEVLAQAGRPSPEGN